MTFSPLIKGTLQHHGKYSSRGGAKIFRVILHHWASVNGGEQTLTDPNRQASANYLVYSNGDIKGQVPEEYRAWTSGSAAADNPSITIEIQNSSAGGQWPISAKAMASVIKLIADVAKRYNWGGVAASNVRGHREFKATACPGPYVWARMGDIREKADAATRKGKLPTTPKKSTPSKLSVSELADMVLLGKYGNGESRKKALGDKYNAVQAEVNRRITGSSSSPNSTSPSAPAKTIAQLADEVIAGKHGTGKDRAKSLGAKYNDVQAEVNRKLGVATSQPAPKQVDIGKLADAVIAGKYGNGESRRKALGANYKAVQAEVNRRLG